MYIRFLVLARNDIRRQFCKTAKDILIHGQLQQKVGNSAKMAKTYFHSRALQQKDCLLVILIYYNIIIYYTENSYKNVIPHLMRDLCKCRHNKIKVLLSCYWNLASIGNNMQMRFLVLARNDIRWQFCFSYKMSSRTWCGIYVIADTIK